MNFWFIDYIDNNSSYYFGTVLFNMNHQSTAVLRDNDIVDVHLLPRQQELINAGAACSFFSLFVHC